MTATNKSRLKRTIIFFLFSLAAIALSTKLPVVRNAFVESHLSGIDLLQRILFSASLIFSGIGVVLMFHAGQTEGEKTPIVLDGLWLIALGNLLVSFSVVFERMVM